jgi:hypothetical protein
MNNRWDRDNQNPLPKPYDFVPLPEDKIKLEDVNGHHIYQDQNLTGYITTTIIARSPVHVGSGLLELSENKRYPLVKGLLRSQNQPVIPGSSLKGCIRSIVEAITASAVQVTRARELPRQYKPPIAIEKLDIAQQIFGTLDYQGLVRFHDAVLEVGEVEIVPSVQLFRPRSESYNTYFDGSMPKGRKFYMHGKLAEGNLPLEACAVDSRFFLRIDFENISRAQLGVFLIALGIAEPRFNPKLGGAKPACLGTIEFTDLNIFNADRQNAYHNFELTYQALTADEFIQTAFANNILLTKQLNKLAEILQWPNNNRNCPDRSY